MGLVAVPDSQSNQLHRDIRKSSQKMPVAVAAKGTSAALHCVACVLYELFQSPLASWKEAAKKGNGTGPLGCLYAISW